MELVITLITTNPEELVDFWSKALSLKPLIVTKNDKGRINYADLYFKNKVVMRIVQSLANTTNVIISKQVWKVNKEYEKLLKRGLPCIWFPQKKDLFYITDPQGNELYISKNPNIPEED